MFFVIAAYGVAQIEHPQDRFRAREAGVPVVEAGASIVPAASHTLSRELALTRRVAAFGRDDGAESELFGRVVAVAIDDADRIYVLDQAFESLRVFSAHGEFLGRVGSAGQGPGEFTRASAMAIDPDGDVHVADGSRRVHVFRWDDDVLTYREQYRIDMTPYGMCFLGDQLFAHAINYVSRAVLAGEQAAEEGVVHRTGDGSEQRSFGAVYRAQDPMVNYQHSRGILTCAEQTGTVVLTPRVNLGESHGFGLDGSRLWITEYTEFLPHEVVVLTGRPRRTVREVLPDRGAHAVQSAVVIDGRHLLVRFVLTKRAEDRNGREAVAASSYLVDTATGAAARIEPDPGSVVAANPRYLVVQRDVPDPGFEVRARQRR